MCCDQRLASPGSAAAIFSSLSAFVVRVLLSAWLTSYRSKVKWVSNAPSDDRSDGL